MNVATIALNAYVVGPTTSASRRVHEICRISDDAPEIARANAATALARGSGSGTGSRAGLRTPLFVARLVPTDALVRDAYTGGVREILQAMAAAGRTPDGHDVRVPSRTELGYRSAKPQ